MTWDGEGIDPWLPARLAAEARITGAERRLYNEWLASMGRWLVKAKRQVYANGAVPDPTGVFTAAPEWAREMDRLVDGPVKDTMGEAYRELFGDGYRFDTRPAVVEHLASVRNRMVRTSDDVFGLVAGEVAAGATSGASIPEIRDRVDKILSSSGTERWRGRAVTVARTETIGSLNAGRADSFEAASEELGEPMESMWLSTVDLRTRPSHAFADGQRVPVGTPFEVGGASLRFPGDPFGPAEEVINCRCTTLLVGADEEVDLSDRQYTEDDWDEWNDSRQEADVDRIGSAAPPRDLETKARERQASIDKARGAGSAAAELDEVVGNLTLPLSDAGRKALEHRIGSQVARNQIPAEVADDLRRALADGDLPRMSAVAWKHAGTQGARRIDGAGEVVLFDRKRHQPLGGKPTAKTQVLVTKPGVEWEGDNGLLLEKARVDVLDDVDLFNARLALAKADRDALAAAPSGLGRTTTRLTKPQREALEDYQGTLYYGINGQLDRVEVDQFFAVRIQHLDDAMDGSVLTDDVATWRGIRDGRRAFGDRFDKDLTGATWTDRRFVSTSASERVARDFTYEGASIQHTTPTVMRLLVPKGTKGVVLDNADQLELLLQRGLSLRVVKDHGDVDGIRRVDVEVLQAPKVPKARAAAKPKAAKVAKPPKRPKDVKLEIRPELAGTPAKVATKFAAEWKRITGRDIEVEVPKGASGATLREHYEGLLRAAERFPFVDVGRVDWWDNPAGEYAQILAQAGGRPSLQFGGSWLGTTARTRYLKSLLNDADAGWSPPGFSSPATVALRQFGRILHRHSEVDGDAVAALVKAALRRHAEAGDHRDAGGDLLQSLAAREGVSGTASNGVDDLVADAFADVLLNGPRASALSREVFDILEDGYKTGAERAARIAARRDADARAKSAGIYDSRVKAAAKDADALDAPPANLATGTGLTPAQKSALTQYMDAGAHDRINKALREGRAAKLKQVDQIDAAMANSALARDVVVYRGVSARYLFGDGELPGNLSGREWHDPAYMFTSARLERAKGFGGDDQVVLRILVPRDTHAVTISPYNKASGIADEAELLLDRGLRFRVVSDRTEVDYVNRLGEKIMVRHLDVEVVDDVLKDAAGAKRRRPGKATTPDVKAADVPSTDPPGVAALDRGKPPTLKGGAVDTNPKFGTTRLGPTYRDAAKAGKRWDRSMGDVPSGAYEENCTNVVMAFEMRMRGYRVVAGPLDVLDKYGYAAGRTAKELDDLVAKAWRSRNGSPHGRSFAGQEWRSFDQIDAEVAAWDEGGRGFVTVGKHVFNVVKVRGKAQYMEAQYDATPSRNVTSHYKRKFAGQAKVIRLDDLVPTDDILQTLDVIREV